MPRPTPIQLVAKGQARILGFGGSAIGEGQGKWRFAVSVCELFEEMVPEDTLTDVSERFIAAELVREQVFRMTGEEIPYATAVTVDTFKEKKGGRLISIEATIHLERSSQKGIVIGKNGSKLKQIGTRSRKQIEQLLGTKVYLKLSVRIQKNWRKDTKAIRRFGY